MHQNLSRFALVAAGLLLVANGPAAESGARRRDSLREGFRHPPAAARPRVWWHWMDGNISIAGARLDLAWLHRIGVGGVHVFEAGMGTPRVVARPLDYMSPAWRAALRDSVRTTRRLGLDFGIATSPGWSNTGASWVQPADAMKKLVWSETRLEGGTRFRGVLPHPPTIAGPYQDIAANLVDPGAPPGGPMAYGDARVLAVPGDKAEAIMPFAAIASAGAVSVALLADGAFGPGVRIGAAGADARAWIAYDFGAPRMMRSVTVGLPGARGFGAPKAPLAFLEASDDGRTFRRVAALPPTSSPVRSAAFAPVEARWFRLVIAVDPAPGFMDNLSFAPGAVRPPFGAAPATGYDVSEFVLGDSPHVAQAEEKAGFATLPDYDAAASPAGVGVEPGRVIDLTSRMQADGSLDWTAPAGHWKIIRLGWSLTGHRNGPAPASATGLEVDKLDARRVGAYARRYLGDYRTAVGPALLGARGIGTLLSDSIEAGPQNWTESLPAEFQRRRGYDPTPWLPALTGMVIGDAARTDRFLWDWRKTIADLYADSLYGSLAREAHRAGLVFTAEALEDHRPQLGDDMAMRAQADVPTGAMWMVPPGGEPNATYVADLKGAASVANIYGKPLVAAESLTAFGHPWGYAPRDLKATADLEFALGVNRMMIHSSAHQPLIGPAPGLALATFLGQYFNRNETWADFAGAWIDYLARSSFLLQQGTHVANIAYFYGEEAPLTSLFGDHVPLDLPAGHDYDFVDADALARLSVVDGQVVARGTQRYRLIQLGGDSRLLTLATLRRLGALVSQGAVLVGARPDGSPSLADDDTLVAHAIAALWDGAPGPHRYGKGWVFGSDDSAAALAQLGLSRDWTWAGDAARLAVIHRRLPGGELYFVSNQSGAPVTGDLALRVAGRAPELWDALTGDIAPLSYRQGDERTTMPLSLGANQAVFLVFRRPTTRAARTIAPAGERTLASLDGAWSLSFQGGRGAPAGTRDSHLERWDQSADPAIRYFSGVGSYGRHLSLGTLPSGRLMLDLGAIGDIARVTVNGRAAGIAWNAPYRVDVTGLLKRGDNVIRVEVANLWVNRLIGDQQQGATKIATVTGPTYRADAPLRPSGLFGPVRLLAVDPPMIAAR